MKDLISMGKSVQQYARIWKIVYPLEKMNKTIPEYERILYPWGESVQQYARIWKIVYPLEKMNKTIPEYERSHIHGRSVQYARIWKIVYPLEK